MVKKRTGKDKMMGDKMKSMGNERERDDSIDSGQQTNARQQEPRQDEGATVDKIKR